MPKISSSEDVYRIHVDQSNESWIYGLLSFAVVEEQRIEWIRHYREEHGETPDAQAIEHWYEQQPESVLLRAKGTAENALQLYADDVLQEVLETERREISDGLIIDEIRMGRRLLPQFGINVAGGFFSAFLFAALLTVLYFIAVNDVSLTKVGIEINDQHTQEKDNGKKASKQGSN